MALNPPPSPTPVPRTREEAEALDAADPLAAKRALFVPPPGVAYLDGHSLGPPTRAAIAAVSDGAARAWPEALVSGWNTEDWFALPGMVAAKVAPLVGARAEELIVTDTVSVNLFKLAGAALPLAAARIVIVETDEFPTDAYIAAGLSETTGAAIRYAEPGRGADVLAETGGVLIKSFIGYRSGKVADAARYEAAAKAKDGFVVWDLSHATGVVPIDLARNGMRLATGCTYKYLNGGPGAPSFVFAEAALADALSTPIKGWFGHDAPFAFDLDYRPLPGAARFATGTPPILSLLALSAALDTFEGVAPADLWAKAGALGDLCIARLGALGLVPQVPADARERGAHVSFGFGDGYALIRALIDRGVHGDFREPDTVRFGLSPLTLSFGQVWAAMDVAGEVIETRAYDDARYRVRSAVT